MKIKQIILSLGLLVVGSMMLSSCTKNDDNTIALIGTEYYIDDILSVIPDSLQTRGHCLRVWQRQCLCGVFH